MRFPFALILGSCVLLAACSGTEEQADMAFDNESSEETVELNAPVATSSSSAPEFRAEDIVAYRDECTKDPAPSATTVQYEDAPQGFSITIPFHESWGSAPYVMTEEGMRFGPPVSYTSADGGCATEAAFTLKVMPKRSAEEARDALIADYESHAVPTPPHGWGVGLIMVDRRVAVAWGIGEWVCVRCRHSRFRAPR
jgi:hypothetical protein